MFYCIIFLISIYGQTLFSSDETQEPTTEQAQRPSMQHQNNHTQTLNDNEKKLLDAATNNSADMVRVYLHEPKININLLDPKGQGLLHIAVRNDNVEMVTYLLGHPRVNVNLPDRNLKTPLILAAELERVHIVKILLARKDIDLFALDKKENDAMEYAKRKDNQEIFEMFKKAMYAFLTAHKIPVPATLQQRLLC
ncbi:MAG: ankyrin repeat domain-containing protein [Candidatus Babeliales bacterium]